MKKILTLMLLVLVSLSSIALAKKPVKIARIPIIVQQSHLDYETSAALEVKMARVVKLPANPKTIEYIPPKESEKVLGKIWKDMYNQNRNAQMTEAIEELAEKLDADLVICPILREYSQRVSPADETFKTHLTSSATFEMIVYDRNTGEMVDKRVSRNFSNNYSKYGTASYLAGQCLDKVIEETGLRQTIRDLKK